MSRFTSKLSRYNTINCQQVMPVPVVPLQSLTDAIPTPICNMDHSLFPLPEESNDPAVIPMEIGIWYRSMPYQPPGTILKKEQGSIPDGYLLCDANAVSREIYANLFTVLGTYYGDGDGSTTFNLPSVSNVYETTTIYIIKY
jgi:Phage Tail Collar Domain